MHAESSQVMVVLIVWGADYSFIVFHTHENMGLEKQVSKFWENLKIVIYVLLCLSFYGKSDVHDVHADTIHINQVIFIAEGGHFGY